MADPARVLTVVVLTRDEAVHLTRLVTSFHPLACNFVVVDSGSTDGTQELARQLGAQVLHHPFDNHAAQFNWALDLGLADTPWTMRMDADEYLSPGLAEELQQVLQAAPTRVTGLMVRRRIFFWGRWIRHGGVYPTWLLRIWRTGHARVEARLMDEHVVLSAGEIGLLRNDILHENLKGLASWIEKHNGYAESEVLELLRSGSGPLLVGQAAGRRRLKVTIYSRAPLFLRALLYWGYRYFLRLGFLDGLPGLVFHFFQALWYRFLVDAKLYERNLVHAVEDTTPGSVRPAATEATDPDSQLDGA